MSNPSPETIAPLELLRQQSRTDESDDQLLTFYRDAAIAWIESRTGLLLTQQTVVEAFAGWDRWLNLSRWPITEITSIGYVAHDGTDGALDASAWRAAILRRPGRVAYSGHSLPRVECSGTPISVTYSAGYADGAVPALIKQAIAVLVSEFFANREAGAISADADRAVSGLLRGFRVRRL